MDEIVVTYRDTIYRFRPLEAGAVEPVQGVHPTGKWEGRLELGLMTEPENVPALQHVLEAMTRVGFHGLIVGDLRVIRFSAWTVTFIPDSSELVARCLVHYSTIRTHQALNVSSPGGSAYLVE